MSITLQCVVCKTNCITLHQPAEGITPWLAICKPCYDRLETELSHTQKGKIDSLRVLREIRDEVREAKE